jgi:biopolymer transport protein ExbB/TolQ
MGNPSRILHNQVLEILMLISISTFSLVLSVIVSLAALTKRRQQRQADRRRHELLIQGLQLRDSYARALRARRVA